MNNTLLGGLTTQEFLREYWHKKPLLIRGAIPGFRNLLDTKALFRLAERDDCEARLIRGGGKKWTLEHGPFPRSTWRNLPASRWTVLVQGLNTLLPAADALLRRFSFIPYARLDDLMVSYAVEGGGVGPHVDSYDVFLLQGEGRRRWRISEQKDLALEPKAPLKLLRDFRPEQEWVLEAGDMLYLPPHIAHEGTALDECMTYSIGFRAPTTQEFAAQFLAHLQDRLALPGRYADPGLRPQTDPARVHEDVVAQAVEMLRGIRWDRAEVAAFVGSYLSEPKPHIQFDRPPEPLTRAAFAKRRAAEGLRLALASVMLYRGADFYLNGERCTAPPAWRATLRKLANDRCLPAKMQPGSALDADLAALLYDWYCAGYLLPGSCHET